MNNKQNHVAFFRAGVRAIYSALVDDNATVSYFFGTLIHQLSIEYENEVGS